MKFDKMLYLDFEKIVKKILSIKLHYYFLLGSEPIPFVDNFLGTFSSGKE